MRRWIKWYGIDWINSTARDELNPAERSTFLDFVCLASYPGSAPGTFKVASWDALARKLNTPLEVILSTKEKCLLTRISVENNSEGLLVAISNWSKYQAPLKSDNSSEPESPKSDNKTVPQKEKRRRREGEEKESLPLPPSPPHPPGEDSSILSLKEKKKYGEFGNVLLTEEEYLKLAGEFGEVGTHERIKALALYIQSKGTKYKSHYATILNWERMKSTKEESDARFDPVRRYSKNRVPDHYTDPKDIP